MASVDNSIRVTKLSSNLIKKIQKGEVEDLVVEFKLGDRLPVNLKAEGDLFESVDSNPTFVEVKKDFYLNIKGSSLNMSLDGVNFKPFTKVAKSKLSISTPNDNAIENYPASAINLVFSSLLM